ncbi:MAG: hypothetical protein LW721_05790 [Flammeovirgaceae bacterium]|nr:hypothetical protein [Flammeovirgaceae bacterium]
MKLVEDRIEVALKWIGSREHIFFRRRKLFSMMEEYEDGGILMKLVNI